MNRKALLLLLLIALSIAVIRIPEARAQEPQGEPGSFGHIPPPANYTAFWSLFNRYSAWDLEANTGSGWFSVKQDLTVDKNYADPGTCKITLIFEASYSADYRLTFGIDLRVKNYTYRENLTRYSLKYQNYTVFFDFSDLLEVPQLQFSHGVKEVDGKDVFWFRARRDNVPVGAYLELDPSFGYSGGVSWFGIGAAYFMGGNFTSPSVTYQISAYKITAYVDVVSATELKFAVYKYSDLSFVASTQKISVSPGINTITGYFQPLLVLNGSTAYLLCISGNVIFEIYYTTTTGVNNTWRDNHMYEDGFPSTFSKDDVYQFQMNILCYYHDGYSVDSSVSQSTDDVHCTASPVYWDLESYTIRAGRSSDGTFYWYDTGVRFQTLNVPRNSDILYAYLVVYGTSEDVDDTVRSKIFAEDTDDAGTFTTRTDFMSRDRTTNYIQWDSIPHFYADLYYQSPDISSVIQEVTDRTGWAAMNDIVLFWGDQDQRSSGFSIFRYARSWDGDNSESASLQIIWRPPIEIGEFEASASAVYNDEWFNVNCSLNDQDGIANIKNCTLALNGSLVLAWDNATATFSINQDPNFYCTLNSTACIEEETNSTAFTLSWRIKLTSSYPTGSIDVLSSSTEVYDIEGASGSGSYSGLFNFALRQEYQGGPVGGGPTKTPLEDLGFPPIIPTKLAPIEAQYGTIALVLIMGGAVIYYLRKPRGARELWASQDRKAPKRSRSKKPKPSKNSGKIQRNFKKKRERNPKKW